MPPKSPPVLFDATNMVLQVMENKETAVCLMLALDQLKQYEAIAKRQNKRIWEAQRRAGKAMDRLFQANEKGKTNRRKLRLYTRATEEMNGWYSISNAEAHFYLIAWAAAEKLIQILNSTGNGFTTLDRILRVHRARFKGYRDARDHVEHLDERLPGQNSSRWQVSESERYIKLSGNMGRVRLEGKFTFRNDEGRNTAVDISPISAELLERICREVREGLTAELRPLFESGKTLRDMRPKLARHGKNNDSPQHDHNEFSHVVNCLKTHKP